MRSYSAIKQQQQSLEYTIIPQQQQQLTTIQQSYYTALLHKLKLQLYKLSTTLHYTKYSKSQLTKRLKHLLEQKEFYNNEKLIQYRKYKSLNLLVNELQSGWEKIVVEMKSKYLQLSYDEDKKVVVEGHLLREELIKLNYIIKDDEKIYSFLKQLHLNTPNIATFIKKSDFIESQAYTIAKLQTYINQLANPNFYCRRKWNMVEKELYRGERHLKVHKLQVTRQTGLLKELYEYYLYRINSAKMKIVNFTYTKRDKLLTDYLIEQMSLTQQTRMQVYYYNKNLHYHKEQLDHEYYTVNTENKELESFFLSENKQYESRLAMKMRQRIDELKDSLKEMRVRNYLLGVVNKRDANLQYVRVKVSKSKYANDFLFMKQYKINQGNFSQIDEQYISQFFTAIIKQTYLKTQSTKYRSLQMNAELKYLKMKELLLESQVGNLEEIVKENSVEKSYQRREIGLGLLGR